jgi:cobalamin biosynthesis protein CobD/CbiB
MKKFAVFLGSTVLVLGLTACTPYQGFYRYPCQEPANWETPECKPPVCSVAGTCPVDLVGEEVFNGETTTTDSGATPNG